MEIAECPAELAGNPKDLQDETSPERNELRRIARCRKEPVGDPKGGLGRGDTILHVNCLAEAASQSIKPCSY